MSAQRQIASFLKVGALVVRREAPGISAAIFSPEARLVALRQTRSTTRAGVPAEKTVCPDAEFPGARSNIGLMTCDGRA